MTVRCCATGACRTALPLSMWIDELEQRDLCLTKSDIEELRPHEELKILFLDQHVFDIAEIRGNRSSLKPEEFFRSHYWCVFRKQEGLCGWARFMYESRFRAFGLHMEYKPGCWAGIRHGRLQTNTEDQQDEAPSTFPEDYGGLTRVGWLGPAVKWAALKDMPNVYLG